MKDLSITRCHNGAANAIALAKSLEKTIDSSGDASHSLTLIHETLISMQSQFQDALKLIVMQLCAILEMVSHHAHGPPKPAPNPHSNGPSMGEHTTLPTTRLDCSTNPYTFASHHTNDSSNPPVYKQQ